MATWSDVLTWRPEPLADASDGLKSLHTSLTGMEDDAQAAGSRVASQAPSVEAALGALRRCTASHGEMTERVGNLARATSDACEGVAQVRRKALACLDFASEHPYLTLGADGSVSVSLTEAAGSGAGKAASSPMAAAAGPVGLVAAGLGGAVVEAAQAQADAAELEEMVASTLTMATQVDDDYAVVLAASGDDDQERDPDRTDRRGRYRDPIVPWLSERRGKAGGKGSGGDGAAPEDELGDPVPGEHAEMPGVEPWQYPGDSDGEGSGAHGQKEPTLKDRAMHEAAVLAATAVAGKWPNASENLLHFLRNSGAPKEIDADDLLKNVPSTQKAAQEHVEGMAGDAMDDAQASGATGPVTYPFSTAWENGNTDEVINTDWYYALGGFQYATDGTITVYPPTADNPEWTYSYDYRVHIADRYNWDEGKSVEIGGMEVRDEQLQDLHEAGLAQEYDVTGESSVRSGP